MFCVKDSSKDNLVSESIASGDGWEWESVSKIMEAMSLHPEAVFIGMYNVRTSFFMKKI